MEYTFNSFQLDTDLFELRYREQQVPLEPQVYAVLSYLLVNRDRIISKQELLDKLWEGRIVTESSLNTCIKEARKAVNDSGQDQHTIATVHRRGYRFIAAVEEIVSQKPGSSSTSHTAHTEIHSESTQKDNRLSLVVMPFTHKPGDLDSAWWAEVFSEDISIHLARISGFVVISRHSVMTLNGDKDNPQKVGQILNTRYIITGSIRNFKQEYRISIQLVDVMSGQLLWANHKRLLAEDIEGYQNEVITKIVLQIEPELNRAEFKILRHRKPMDMSAWSRCREVNALLGQKGWNKVTFAEVTELLRDAIRREPELAFAHAYLSLIIALGHLIGLIDQADWKQEATRAAETALSLDCQDSDVLGHTGCAFADMGDFQRGIPLMERAIELNPANAAAWAGIGAAKMRNGDESGIEDMQRGISISPRDNRVAAWGAVLARGLLSYNRVNESIEAARNACRYDDKIFLPRVILAIAFCTQGDHTNTILSWKDAKRIQPDLCLDDISQLASSDEMSQLRVAGII